MVKREIPKHTLLGGLVSAWSQRRERRALAALSTSNPRTIHNAPRSERRAVSRAIAVLQKSKPQAIKNWYEGGFPFLDGTRSYIPSIIQDARYDQNLVTRRELLRRMRYWSQNSGICKSTIAVSRRYTIGTHAPVVTSLSSDSDWADRAEKVFEEMIATAGISDESLYSMLTVAHDAKKTDGDVLFVETSVQKPVPVRRGTKYQTAILKSVPRLQMVEGHRIETPPSQWKEEGITIFDGVRFDTVEQKREDGTTRKTAVRSGYYVKDSFTTPNNNDAYSFIPCSGSLLIFSPTRVNQVRGISDYYAGETTLALLEDLLKLEMKAQEVQSNLSVFITNGAGQIVNDNVQATIGALNIKLAKDDQGNPVVTSDDIQKAKQIYKQVWGGETFVGRTGDTLGFLAPTRPAEATLNLWEYLINVWCVAASAPRILVFPKANKGQGTEVRAELDSANTAFIGEFNLNWKPLMQRAWEYFIGWAIENDSRLVNPPEDWKSVEVSPPRSVMVDAGYDSSAQLAELAAGVSNLHFIAQRLGTTAKRLIAMAVQDIYNLKKACLKASGKPNEPIEVKPEEVRQSLAQVVKAMIKPDEKEKEQVEE